MVRAAGIAPIVDMLGHCLTYGLAGLCFTFTYRPEDYPDTASLILRDAAILMAIGTLLFGGSERRRQLLAVALLAIASYGMIAAGRSPLLRGQLELAGTQWRYHYSATAGLTVALCVLVAPIGRLVPARVQSALLALFLVTCVGVYAACAHRIVHFDESRRDAEAALTAIRSQIRMAAPGQRVYIQNRPFGAIGPMVTAGEFPGWAALFVIYFPDRVVDGHEVTFVAGNRESIVATRGRGRIAALLVAPEALRGS
jgi:hypothetical protein